MGLFDDYKNVQQDRADEETLADPSAARRKRAEIERQIAILDSDLKKTIREIEDLEAQKRRFKKEEERIRVERDALDKDLKKVQNDWMLFEEDIKKLKKELKTLP